MNLRQIIGSSVVLACVLAVYSSPIVYGDDGESCDIQARGYENFDLALQLRELALSYAPSDSDDLDAVHDKRATKPAPAKPKAKPAPAPAKPKPAPAKPKPAPAPAKPKPAPAPAKPKPASAPAKPKPGSKPPPSQPGNKPPPKNSASCKVKRRGLILGKRAFDTTCKEATLTLGGVTKTISQVGQQGNSAITYQVVGGWPDPTTGKDVTAYAKTGKTPSETFSSEIKWLGKTDQLLAEGKYEGRQFIVFHGVTGKLDITGTTYWKNLAQKFMMKGDMAGCEAEVKKTLIPLIVKEAKVYVDKFQVLHTDVQPGNILWDAAGADPTLIDWGRAEEVASWSDAVAKRVTAQAEFSFLKGDERICHNFSG
ncbi:hypothetical protein ONZ45_g7332 [Pleurotus djamor]|nr:hypothetical protein ONZ45_g7332 [Pleurotus djamor]